MLTSPSGKSYIGQTIRPIEERLRQHQKPNSVCVAINRAIQKHGWDNFEKHWYEVPDEDLNDHEKLMVEVLGTLSPGGYNLREGGGSGGKPCEESRKKMSEARIGKALSKETKIKLSEANSRENNPMYGKTHTKEIKQKIRETSTGRTHKVETKKKISESQKGDKNHMYGKTPSDETKRKMSETKKGVNNPNSKRIFQYDINNTFIQSFATSIEAARSLDKSSGSAISSCAHGTRKTAYGFKWSFTEL